MAAASLHAQVIGDAIFREAYDGFVIVNPLDMCIVEVNPVIQRLSKRQISDLVDLPITELIEAENPESMERFSNACKETDHFSARDGYILNSKAGKRIPIEICVSRVHFEPDPFALVVIRDITERKQSEKFLRESHDWLQLAQEAAGIGTFDWDVVNNSARCSATHSKIYGLHPSNNITTVEQWLECLHPNDRARCFGEIQDALYRGVTWNSEFRVVWPNGSVHWLHSSAQVYFDDNGKPIRMIGAQTDITERKLADQAKREDERCLREIFEGTPDAIFVESFSGIVLEVNSAACDLHRMEREALIGKHVSELVPHQYRDVVDQSLKDMAHGTLSHFEGYSLTSDGESIPVEIHARAFHYNGRPALLLNVRDITERKRSEAAVAESEHMLRSVLDNIPHGVFLKDNHSQYLMCNKVVADSFGLENPNDIIGMTDYELSGLSSEQADFFVSKDKQVIDSNQPELGIVEQATLADGRSIWMETNKIPHHDMNGNAIGVLGTWQDITDRKTAEGERLNLESKLHQKQKLESLGVLAGGIAHDFNNMLTSIVGNGELALRKMTSNPVVRKLIKSAVSGARQASELTNQLLAYSGQATFLIRPVNISKLTEEMAKMLSVSVSKNCILRYELNENLPQVRADIAQMRQVIMNLIINASEAIGSNNGAIRVVTGVRQLTAADALRSFSDNEIREGAFVFLEVADDGCGLSKEMRDNIFDPFYTTKANGRGLGLSAVLGIIRGHHGTIECTSEPGNGTTFTIYLPVDTDEAAPKKSQPMQDDEFIGQGIALVVDDDASVRMTAEYLLDEMGFTVMTAGDGQEGVELYLREADRIRFVLLDHSMPRMSGLEAFHEMRKARDNLPVIFASGYDASSAPGVVIDDDLATYVQKPYGFRDLTQALREILVAVNA